MVTRSRGTKARDLPSSASSRRCGWGVLFAPVRRPREGSAMQARMATYSFSGDADDLARRAEEGILPILKSQPGFKSYSVAIGDGEVLSLSVWETRADAETGSEVVASWVAENMAGDIELKEVRYAEIKFSTTLGVSTLASATA